MATSKPKKSRNRIDPEQLKSEVASFASSLGFSSAAPSSSGFNDIDFRNPSRPKPPKTPKTQNPNHTKTQNPNHTKDRNADKNNKNNNNKRNNNSNNIKEERPKPGIQPQPQSHAQSPLAPIDNSKLYEKYRNLPKLPLMKATSLAGWYEDAAKLEEKVLGSEVKRKKVEFKDVEEWKTLVAQKKELAERLLAQYVQDYEASRGQSGDIKMVIATQRSGTATDKVSALSVLIGDNPIANIKSIDALLGMVTSKVGKRYAFTGFETLKEMFIESLLPDRKLKTLFQQHLNHLPETKDGYSLLLFWHWEECLKQRYERYIFALEEASKDVLATLKDRASKIIYALLRSKSEQERRLLSGLVNKLGDPENKAASNADFLLTKLLSEHPNMKAVVIDEVDNFLFRPHLGLRAKYHAVNFLSQIRLHHRGDGPKVAKRLVDLYFALFKLLISEARGLGKQKDGEENKKTSHTSKDKDVKSVAESHVEMDSRLLSALLTGVNRAFPFVSSNEADDVIEVQTPMLFQLVHSKNFNVGIQSLMLLDKISSKNQIVSDRFYRALYSKLLTPSAMNSSKEEMLIGLLLRAMKNDINLKRVAAFAKRLLQVALQQPPQHACGILFLLSEILKARPPLWNLVLQNESADDELEHFEDVVEEAATEAGNIADKPDIAAEASPDSGNLDAADDDDDDDSPLNEGASPSAVSEDESDDADDDFLANGRLGNLQETELISTHSNDQPGAVTLKPSLPGGYNPRHREPSFCNADRVSWWELTVLASHVHPSVATMAKTLLSGANIVYNGNPLTDLSLTAFLDKLMEKKPKQSAWHGGSEIEPANKLDMSDQKIGAAILELDETDVAPEDLVFHKFYMNKLNSSKRSKKKKKKGAEEDGAEDLIGEDGSESDGDSDIDEEEIDKMLDSTDGALDADGEYDYDDLDQIVNEDDDDLVGDDSDGEEFPMDEMGGDDEEAGMDEFDEDTINTGDEQDESDEEDIFDDERKKKKRERKEKTKAGASPFASAEAYKHLLDEENPVEAKQKKGKKEPKSRKKRKPSK